jgi:hypothetical protein
MRITFFDIISHAPDEAECLFPPEQLLFGVIGSGSERVSYHVA